MPIPLETLTHAMLERSRKDLILASSISATVSTYLMSKGRVVMEDGGPEISNPLIVGLNPNISSMQYYDEVPVAQTNEFTTMSYTMSRVVGTMIISDQEEDENQGRAVIFKILDGKMTALKESIKRQFADYFTSVGTGSDPNGLGNLIPADPTTGSIGGLSLAAEPQLRSSAYDFNGTLNTENIEEAFDDIMELDLNRDGERPTVIFAGRNIYRMHKGAARDKTVINLDSTGHGKQLINLGIRGTTHGGVPLLFDEKLDPNEAFFVNDKYMSLHVLKGANMKIKKLIAPWDMDAIGRRIVWEGQLCSWRGYRTHAFLTNNV